MTLERWNGGGETHTLRGGEKGVGETREACWDGRDECGVPADGQQESVSSGGVSLRNGRFEK